MGLLKRCAKTAVRLPFSVAWDCVSLGNMGEGTSTGKILREHRSQKRADDLQESVESLVKVLRELR